MQPAAPSWMARNSTSLRVSINCCACCAKMRQGTHPCVYYAANLGKKLGKRRRIPSRVYGDTAQKAGKRARIAAVHSDAHRRWIPHDESGMTGLSAAGGTDFAGTTLKNAAQAQWTDHGWGGPPAARRPEGNHYKDWRALPLLRDFAAAGRYPCCFLYGRREDCGAGRFSQRWRSQLTAEWNTA